MYRIMPAMSAARGAESLLRAIGDPDAGQGSFYGPRFLFFGRSNAISLPSTADRSEAARLWRVAEELTGTRIPG